MYYEGVLIDFPFSLNTDLCFNNWVRGCWLGGKSQDVELFPVAINESTSSVCGTPVTTEREFTVKYIVV